MGCRPTGCPSAAASAAEHFQKASDLAREAVSCTGGLDGRLRAALSSRVILLERHGLRLRLQPCHEIVCRTHRCGRGRVNQSIKDWYIIHRVMATSKTNWIPAM